MEYDNSKPQGLLKKLSLTKQQSLSEEENNDRKARMKQISFATAFLKMFYKSRFALYMQEIVLLSQDKYDPGEAILPP